MKVVAGAGRLRALRNDVLLAATALAHRAAVMTRDAGDFERIAEVLPVRLVDYHRNLTL